MTLTGQIVSCDSSGTKYVLGRAAYVGSDITSVSAGPQPGSAQWVVDLSLNSGAASNFGTLTTSQYGSYYAGSRSGNQDDQALDSTAVVLDGNIASVEATAQPITAGQVRITGGGSAGFTQAQATDLANTLRYGSLPLYFKPLAVNAISAQLGRSSLDAGLIAGTSGWPSWRPTCSPTTGASAWWRSPACCSRDSSPTCRWCCSAGPEFTMTLSAIAGLVVAIGVTADSFIVYFERLRDEVRDGKSLRPATGSGWKRARRTILVSDTVAFLAAALLYHFAVSDVQGFAYTLGLTTLIDVLVVFLFTKPMVTLLAGTRFFGGGHRWSGLDPARLGARAPWRSSAR